MGNALTQDASDLDVRRNNTDYKSQVHICLLCHRDDSPDNPQSDTSNIKQVIRQFIRDIYSTDNSTIMLWSTWDIDTDKADIVRRSDVNHVDHVDHMVPTATNVFDIIVSTYCNFGQYDEDLDDVYRLLKPGGLFLLLGYGDDHFGFPPNEWHNAFKLRYELFDNHIRLEHDGNALVPVSIDEENPFVVLQKLRIGTRSGGQRFYFLSRWDV